MKIAIVSENSTKDKNSHILAALGGRGHAIMNAGMRDGIDVPELSYIHTGILAGLLLNLNRANYVVGGCSTGQGFLNVVLQFPRVCCGYIRGPLDAWLFSQINGGNCISLPLNQEYGWAGDVNLRFIFDRLFEVEWGGGYPPQRKDFQKLGRETLSALSVSVHPDISNVIERIPTNLLETVLGFPGVEEIIDLSSIEDAKTRKALAMVLDTRR